MAFNLAKYNLNPFNVAGDNDHYLEATGDEYITSAIGSALQIYANATGNERVNISIDGAPTRYIPGGKGSEAVSELVNNGQLMIILYPVFQETIEGGAEQAAIVKPYLTLEEIVTGDLVLGANIYAPTIGEEDITADLVLGSNAYIAPEGFEVVLESASLEVIDTRTCVLTVTLRPGQKLILDSESYSVLLDGENAIELQSGDWIDELDRETTDIVIEAASGSSNLKASIIYTERYL